jgi:hypothetical protein
LTVKSDADLNTAYTWVIGMLEEIRNKVSITRYGDGHISFTIGGKTTAAIAQYLITTKALIMDS